MKLIALIAVAVFAAPQDMPKPGKEHETLKNQFEGEWTYEAKFFMDPSQPPQEMKGTDSAKMGYGGWWLTSEVSGDMFGQPFHGRWTMTYDTNKKKFVGSWIDSMMPVQLTFEGDVDAAGKVYTLVVDSVDPQTMKPVKERWVINIDTDDSHSMKFFAPGPDGKERNTGEIKYKRKK
ncbi:MAG TPA: DUF1579 domain-containing protein [Planctomycetota bacterium]|nr:DUF1579 domain-containing protein [Planctomycetota bacterium]